ncbi:M56 family metallopeptidase [Niabella drilacis]|uniref:BlaR1 peptidase M56 n=1 Tax=Niabella drilacis (strain DSM 25811 / CCM 8410 / CCUG 62505 / LMG 26954 / E90) TaxID=1285928 RepID=A0A1G6JUP3_NIADE|nr:M56 family metallopeptidase [Niabella drilacis]SDC22460.1 BlaR1 peptidase M56 [Niabella drilacis]
MILYFLKVIACSGLLYGFYFFFLQKEKMLVFNRFFLLACLFVPLILPLVKSETKIPDYLELATLPFEEAYTVAGVSEKPVPAPVLPGPAIAIEAEQGGVSAGIIVFIGVSLLLLVRFVRNLMYYRRLQRYGTNVKRGCFFIVLLDAEVTPHSFMRNIFLNRLEYERGLVDNAILLHEEIHIKQRHSWDILLIELLMIFFWWNPFLFLFKKCIRLNHEFLADTGVVQDTGDRARYQELMLKMVSLNAAIPLSSNFYLVTKKRLIMLYKETTIKVQYTKGMIALFIFIPLLFVFASGAKGSGLKSTARNTFERIADMITAAPPKSRLPAVPADRRAEAVMKTATKDQAPEPDEEVVEEGAAPVVEGSRRDEEDVVPQLIQPVAANLQVHKDSAEIPYRSYPVHKGLSEEKMVEFGKFAEKYVMEDKGKKIFWYGQMLRPALDLYFGMTDEQRDRVNEQLPEVFLAAKKDRLVQVNEKYKNEDRRIIVVYPDGKNVTATITSDEERQRFLEGLGLHLGKKGAPNYTSRTYVYNGKPVAGFSMIYTGKK